MLRSKESRLVFSIILFGIAGLVFLAALTSVLVTVLIPSPTPTPEVTATRTRNPTRTPFPTLTPRASQTPTGVAHITAVVTDTLRVREQPSTDARILGRLQRDNVVRLLSRTDDNQWFSIEYPEGSGNIGWIFGEVVVASSETAALPIGLNAPRPPQGAVYATVRGDGGALRVRAGPGTTYEIVSRIPDGARILLVAKLPDNSWYQTVYPPGSATTGWVSGDFVTLEAPADTIQVAQAPPTPTPGPTPVPQPTRAPNLPTGGSILAEIKRGANSDIVALGENGIVRRSLTQGGESYGARYSPGGERIVFYRQVNSSPNIINHIFVMDFDGGNLQDLSARTGGAYSDSAPDWSPDGSRIVYVRTPRAGAPELWTMNANGSNARVLLRLSSATGVVSDYSPSPRWSPDGGRIAFAAVPRTNVPGVVLYPSVFVINTNGTDERQLTDNDLINTGPVWSSDGSQIAWSAKDLFNRRNWQGWVMNASGSDQRIFLAPPGGDSNNGIQPVAWRGNRVLAAVWTGNWNVFFADASSGGLSQVTVGGSDEIPTDWLP